MLAQLEHGCCGLEAGVDEHGLRVDGELVALHRLSDQKERKLFDSRKHLTLSLVFISA